MRKIIFLYIAVLYLLLMKPCQILSQRTPICPEEDYPEDPYETYDPQLNIRICLNGLGLGCDNCCVTFYYFKRYVNGGNYLDFQLDYVVWEDINDPGNPNPQNCILCGRINEEYIKMMALKRMFLRHCYGGYEYDFRNRTSYNHHVVMRSGCVRPGQDGYPLVCEITGCCYKLYKITINQLATDIQI